VETGPSPLPVHFASPSTWPRGCTVRMTSGGTPW
jgi:hypothetical protein